MDDETIKIKSQVMYTLDLKDIHTTQDLLKVFKAMDTVFSIVEGSEVWHALHEAGLGDLIKPRV